MLEELAGLIKNEELRKKVVQILKDLKLSNPNFFEYKPEKIEKTIVYFTANPLKGFVARDLINHTRFVVELCNKIADVIEEIWKIEVNKDVLISAAILHDIMKVYESASLEKKPYLDHASLTIAELYHRGFSEEILHAIEATSNKDPKTIEAFILSAVDNFASIFEFNILQPIEIKKEEKEEK